MSKKKSAYVYVRQELPDQSKLIPQIISPVEEYAKKHHIEIEKVYHDAPTEHKQYIKMMQDCQSRKFDLSYILILSLHHLTTSDLIGVFRQLVVPVGKGISVTSVEDDFTFTKDNIEQFKTIFRLFDENSKRLKTEKINLGIYKKKQRILAGEEAPPKKRGGNYRKTDRDEAVSQLRSEGLTLKEIAEKEGMSVGRVRAILGALKEKAYEELDNPQNLLKESKGENMS